MTIIEKHIDTTPVNFIGGFYLENLVVCDNLVKYFNNNPGKQIPGRTGKGYNKDLKDSTDIYIDPQDRSQEWQMYMYELNKVLLKYSHKFPRCTQSAEWAIKERTNLQHYKPGGGYHSWHSERLSGGGAVGYRALVFMTYLNDVTDAGETEFDHQQVKIKPEKGLTLIWPVDWTYYHRGVPSPTQDKYIITGWLSYLT
jgi:hypothetical protein